MSIAKKSIYVLVILIIPVLLSMSTCVTRPSLGWSRMFGSGTSWRFRESTGLQRYDLNPGEAEVIIEVDAARFGMGIRFADAEKEEPLF